MEFAKVEPTNVELNRHIIFLTATTLNDERIVNKKHIFTFSHNNLKKVHQAEDSQSIHYIGC